MALDADSEFVVSYFVGGRDGECAKWFMDDVAARLASRVQLTSDDHRIYLEATEGAFGCDVDFAQLMKSYGAAPDGGKGHYSPAECTGAKKVRVQGHPDMAHVSTPYVERQNFTMRRFTRLTNAFSKRVENHAYAVALHHMEYDFVRLHGEVRVTPAMAAGVTGRLWKVADIVALVEAADAPAKKRGSYDKKSVGGPC